MFETTAARCRAGGIALGLASLVAGAAACGGSSSSGGSHTSQPSDNASSASVNPTGSTSFSKISPKRAAQLEKSLPTLGGVRSVAYYPKTHSLQVFFNHASANDQRIVKNVVTHPAPAPHSKTSHRK